MLAACVSILAVHWPHSHQVLNRCRTTVALLVTLHASFSYLPPFHPIWRCYADLCKRPGIGTIRATLKFDPPLPERNNSVYDIKRGGAVRSKRRFVAVKKRASTRKPRRIVARGKKRTRDPFGAAAERPPMRLVRVFFRVSRERSHRSKTARPAALHRSAAGANRPRSSYAATLRGRPPLRPFTRAARVLATLRAAPPRLPISRIHRREPNTPASSIGSR